jgi:hypothetical protein
MIPFLNRSERAFCGRRVMPPAEISLYSSSDRIFYLFNDTVNNLHHTASVERIINKR